MRPPLIRRLRPEDVEAVVALDHLCIPTPWSAATFASEATNPHAAYFVLENGAEVLGYIGGHVFAEEAHVFTLGVHPRVRRRGYADALLLTFLRTAQAAGVSRVTLEVRESNAAALRLYAKRDFRPVGRRRAYYPDNHEDALVLWITDLQQQVLPEADSETA